MAVSQSSACAQVSNLVAHADLSRPQSPKVHGPSSITHLKNDTAFQGTPLRSGPQTRSMAAFKAPKPTNAVLKDLAAADEKKESVSQLVSQVSEDIATTSGEFLDAVDSVIEDGPANMRVRKSSGKSATRTSRRRALVMCLALGMVRPCASNVTGGMQTGSLRKTSSTSLRRSASSSFTVSGNLASQVSIASTLKATNLLDDKEDLSAQL